MRKAIPLATILFSIFLAGCATSSSIQKADFVPQKDCTYLNRHPDAVSCLSFFDSNSVILTKKVIESVPSFFDAIEKEYGTNLRSLKDYTTKTGKEYYNTDIAINIAAKLFEEAALGSPAGKIYLELGYRVDEVQDPSYVGPQKNRNKIKVLRPPLDLSYLYQRIYELILEKNGNSLNNNNLILPALVFLKFSNEAQKIVYQFVRPGIDQIPKKSNGWKLPGEWDSVQLDRNTFAHLVAQGIMPFEAKMYHHDIAHLVDYILNLYLAPLHRKYFSMQYKLQTMPSTKEAHSHADNYLNEFLMFPNLSRKKMLKDFVGNPANPAGRVADLQDQYDSGRLEKRITFLENNFFKLFDLHGGGSLDGRSLEAFTNASSRLRATIILKSRGSKPKSFDDISGFLIEDSYWGLVKQMTIISAVLRNDLSKLGTFGSEYENISKKLQSVNRVHLKNALINLMGKLEFKVERALSYNMSAEQLFQDITLNKKFNGSVSYRFFKETSVPGSLEYELFVRELYFGR